MADIYEEYISELRKAREIQKSAQKTGAATRNLTHPAIILIDQVLPKEHIIFIDAALELDGHLYDLGFTNYHKPVKNYFLSSEPATNHEILKTLPNPKNTVFINKTTTTRYLTSQTLDEQVGINHSALQQYKNLLHELDFKKHL